ncbi:C-C chemokine receptor type 4-like [Acipenser ruthenus]|uniref:C-C chemokine receptor type 4-like n=1 Tax=Acipenser ruthenus TaxID=7906 RepID=UPI0027417483|nr:C-C chemokine receptor type 4-like [Acipenser ruthenus]
MCDKKDIVAFGARFLPVFYYLVFLLSMLGNGLVLFILFKYEKLANVTNILILSLVVSNLVFISSLPFWATYHSSEWIFGSTMCKLPSTIYFIGFYSSILFLTLMTIDRYLSVVHAISAAKTRRRHYALISSTVVWCVSIAATIPEFILHDVREDNESSLLCEDTGYSNDIMKRWKQLGFYKQIVIFFLLPLIVVLFCYTRIVTTIIKTRMQQKCWALKLIFIIVVIFFLCWTPYNVVIFLESLQNLESSTDDTCNNSLDYASYICRNLAYLHCCVNPVFFTFVGRKFQDHLTKFLRKEIPCIGSQPQSSFSGRSSDHRSPHTIYE